MSLILHPDIVRYSCTCGTLHPISRIYFCRHCLEVRCGYCVSHEIDSNYCANCLENLPSLEARLKKNRCATCYDCPSCSHTLSVRATTVSIPYPDDPTKSTLQKLYYLACAFCRWTSRDAGIPDQKKPTGSWPKAENPNAARFATLMEYYELFAMQERLDKESKKPQPRSRSNYISLKDKYGITMSMLRNRSGIKPATADPRRKEMVFDPNIASTALEEIVEQLPSDIYEKEVDLNSITTMMQRLAEPAVQPTEVSKLIPIHKRLFIKRSQRCRFCEHNVSKPEFNPASIKFKIQLSAYNHVPDIKVFTCEPLRIGSASELMLKLSNPTQHLTSIQFLPLNTEDQIVDAKAGGDASAPRKPPPIVTAPQPPDAKITGALTLPASSVTLLQRDDAAEYDDSGDAHAVQDDPKVVVWRKGNKAMMKMTVTPSGGSVGDQVVVGFVMRYVYTNTMVTLGAENKEKQKVQLSVPVFIKVGRIVGNC